MKKLLFSLIAFFCLLPAIAQNNLSDNAKISLITTSPWNGEVYALYGHTAILVEDDSLGLNHVFNYGFFDLSKPNFMLNFILGKTDYMLGIQEYDEFIVENRIKGVKAVKQVLNFSQSEKQNLWEALYINSLPENRGYRYNFFYDNCATRPRDMIEKYTQGTIVYLPSEKEQSYRDLLHECLKKHPWMKFGIDLIIGKDADATIDVRQKMFLPEYLMNSFGTAKIVKSDSLSIPLIKNEIILLNHDNEINEIGEDFPISPNITGFALLLLTIIVTWIQINFPNKQFYKIYDIVLFGIAGVGGLVIFFLMFFSKHPATDNNWNFVWMNIFSLIFAILFWVKSLQNIVISYHFINFAILTVFIAFGWFIPQSLPLTALFFAMNLWIRSWANFWLWRKSKSTNK